MTAVTPNRSYPYPTGTDSFCAFPEQSQAFAEAVSTDLDALDTRISEVVTLPIARMSLNTPTTFTMNLAGVPRTSIAFDTVDVSTDNMCNLSRSIYGPYVNTAGYYLVGAFLHMGPSGCTSGDCLFFAQFENTSPQAGTVNNEQATWDGGAGGDSYIFMERIIQCSPPDAAPEVQIPIVQLSLDKNGSAFSTINGVNQLTVQLVKSAFIYAYKVRDL